MIVVCVWADCSDAGEIQWILVHLCMSDIDSSSAESPFSRQCKRSVDRCRPHTLHSDVVDD